MNETSDNIESHNEDSGWVLDSLVGFLKGPVWNVTILTYIEQKSVVFDPEDVSDESEQEYKFIYEEYKNLVDRLLSGHMSDLGISEQQFEEACRRADGILANKFRQVLFEQIWAANDFQIFCRFMTQKNIELQLQALEMLAQRFGLVYESFIPHGTDRNQYLNEEVIINEAIKKSIAEDEVEDNEQEVVASVETNTVPNKDITNELQVMKEKDRLEAQHEREHQKLSQAIHSALIIEENNTNQQINDSSDNFSIEKELPPLKTPKNENKPETSSQINSKPIKEPLILAENKDKQKPNKSEVKESEPKLKAPEESGINSDEIRKRTEYLRKQRDKLLEIKKHERDKQLVKMEEQELLAKRPKSAKAMRSVVDDKRDEDLDDSQQSLAFRRSLAARLKAEVVEQQNL